MQNNQTRTFVTVFMPFSFGCGPVPGLFTHLLSTWGGSAGKNRFVQMLIIVGGSGLTIRATLRV